MEKKEKHAKAIEFRNRVQYPAQRRAAITELVSKEEYSESDKVRIDVLFQKISYIAGCENEYRCLIAKLKRQNLAPDKKKLASFEAKL